MGCVLPKPRQALRAFERSLAPNKKGRPVARAALLGGHQFANYLAMTVVLPKRLRNFSTRPPMLSTDFCVPV